MRVVFGVAVVEGHTRQLRFVAEDKPEMTSAAAAVLARIVRALLDKQEHDAA
jgi:hypothetical protein